MLRLYPSVPVNSRTALCTTTLPRGGGEDGLSPILIRRGMAVGYCPYLMHRRTDLYGEDAHLFRPERWEDGLERRVGWGYVPFNGGPRVCLGRKYPLASLSTFFLRRREVLTPSNQRILRCWKHHMLSYGSFKSFRILPLAMTMRHCADRATLSSGRFREARGSSSRWCCLVWMDVG